MLDNYRAYKIMKGSPKGADRGLGIGVASAPEYRSITFWLWYLTYVPPWVKCPLLLWHCPKSPANGACYFGIVLHAHAHTAKRVKMLISDCLTWSGHCRYIRVSRAGGGRWLSSCWRPYTSYPSLGLGLRPVFPNGRTETRAAFL